jgi:hypothetical protein
MENIAQSIGVMFGSSWAAGVNLYLTTAALGIFERMHWISLPDSLKVVSHPLIIAGAIVLFAVEFFADKIPVVDHLWDAVHTFINPVAGAAMGFLAVSHLGPVAQTFTGLVTGGIATSAHLTKSTSRVAVNSTLIPGAGAAASVAKDASVCGMLYLIVQHPIIAGVVVIAFVIFAIWFLHKMFSLVKGLFSFGARKDKDKDKAASVVSAASPK